MTPDCCVCLQAGDAAEQSEGSKKRWYEEKKKRQEEQLAKMGLTPEEAHRLESVEVAEAKYKKKVRTSCTAVQQYWHGQSFTCSSGGSSVAMALG